MPKVSRRKKIIKITVEIIKIESKKKYKRSMKPRAGSLTRQTILITLQPDTSRIKDDPNIKSEMKEEQ